LFLTSGGRRLAAATKISFRTADLFVDVILNPRRRRADECKGILVYFLVTLHTDDREKPDHVAFVDDLIRKNIAFFGGHVQFGDVEAAYVIRAADLAAAKAVAAQDPWVRAGVARAECVRWEVVAINPAAIDPSVAFGPDDV
jgi:prepilin-type processing-associated H-X9-DG protein